MKTCGNCGTTLSGGICQWCQEELYIFTEQNKFLPDNISDDFSNAVKEQRTEAKKNIKKYFQNKNKL